MGKTVKIILLGSFTGNNAGDMVVLESIINDFNNIFLKGISEKEHSILKELRNVEKMKLIIPTLNENGIEFIYSLIPLCPQLELKPIPISKNLLIVIKAVLKLVREFAAADYIYTTAGILFDQKIWNPFYNFVLVYTPLMLWAKFKNPSAKIIGYNVGVNSTGNFIGRYFLKKCVQLHDRIYLREAQDRVLLERLQYKGEAFISADNVFGYYKPKLHKRQNNKKIYINLTLYGVKDKNTFLREIIDLIIILKKEYDVYFVQTSKRDMELARIVCQKAQMDEKRIYCLCLMGYKRIERLLQECDILVGMRMHSIIFSIKAACPFVGISYSKKVDAMLENMHLGEYLVRVDDVSVKALLSAMNAALEQKDKVSQGIYKEAERRYFLCNSYKSFLNDESVQ